MISWQYPDIFGWHGWVAANAISLLVGIILISNICFVVLAWRLYALSVRLAVLAGHDEQRSVLVEKLQNAVEAHAAATEVLHGRCEAAGDHGNSSSEYVASDTATVMRREIEQLISDLMPD